MNVKAAVLTSPKNLEIREFPMPHVEADTMLLRIEMAALCGTDIHMYQGLLSPPPPFPAIPGHEFVGRVEEMGDKASKTDSSGAPLGVGDRVAVVPCIPCGRCHYCTSLPPKSNMCENRTCYGLWMTSKYSPHLFGGFAEYLYVRPDTYIFKTPEKMPVKVAALTEITANVTRASQRIFEVGMPASELGSSVVIQGLGPAGVIFALAARAAAFEKIIALEGVRHRIEMAKKFGVHDVMDITEMDKEHRIKEVKDLTEGRGADIVIECAGNPSAVPEGSEMVRKEGRYLVFDLAHDRGNVPLNPYLTCRRDVTVTGSFSYHPHQFRTAIRFLRMSMEEASDIVTHKFPLQQLEMAIAKGKERGCLKIAATPDRRPVQNIVVKDQVSAGKRKKGVSEDMQLSSGPIAARYLINVTQTVSDHQFEYRAPIPASATPNGLSNCLIQHFAPFLDGLLSNG